MKKFQPEETYKVSAVRSLFDLYSKEVKIELKGSLDIENKKWNIGLIVGSSGTGKTTLAKELFGEYYIRNFQYSKKSIIDDMPGSNIKEITRVFTSVGFSSPPSWLKPYSILSTGEKMRVDLARAILSEKELIVFDEFTSVVDRQVARVTSYAISKAIRKLNKKFIAISCHRDIIDWLEPDWIYDTDQKEFFFSQKKQNQKDQRSKEKYGSYQEKRVLKCGKYLE
ncbi:AAA family ATPase, partial [bacterium]|nr:AAA family ATPase [bacterium]